MIKMIAYIHSMRGRTIETSTKLPRLPVERLDQFEEYAARLRGVFHRADQFQRFRAYLRGLLAPIARKNVEAIASTPGGAMLSESNRAQSLQHFVSNSSWLSERLLQDVREESRGRRRDRQAVWIVQETAFPKKGQHSVGVMRQLDHGSGRKMSCQVAVVVAQVGPRGYFPLANRLYLPGSWLKLHSAEVDKTIPEEYRQFATKSEIALELLRELADGGESLLPVMAESTVERSTDFHSGLQKLGVASVSASQNLRHQAKTALDWLKDTLGLDHFEGRSWHGWHHHVSLVLTAYHYLASVGLSSHLPPFSIPTLLSQRG